MAKFERMPNYRAMYPDASNEVIDCLKKGHRKMEYMEYDLKVERCCVNAKNKTVTFIPSREDSLERLLDEDKQFKDSGETPEEIVIQAVMIRKMMDCVALLPPAEQELIEALFFQGKTEREYSECRGIHYMTIHNRKVKILAKLKKMMIL